MTNRSVIFRPLLDADASALLAFYNNLSAVTIRTFRPLRAQTTLPVCAEIVRANGAEPRGRFDLAAWVGGEIVGWAFLDQLERARPHLGLGVADAYQRQGLGSALLDELLQWAQEQGVQALELMVVNDNTHALHLYTSRGFTVYNEAYDAADELTYRYMSLQLAADLPLRIEEWPPSHPRWARLQAVTDAVGQTKWANVHFDWHQSHHLLVATKGGVIVGFLHLVTQDIGADDELPPTLFHGQPLLEGKVMAFAVVEGYRRQGIGQALQVAALRLAKARNCYQLRSYSSGDKSANHQLKLAMGFALHRTVRGDDRQGGYFIMPLQSIVLCNSL
jgi:GNAT superfamily N-acetyltransferase